jgi:hypothetical protein
MDALEKDPNIVNDKEMTPEIISSMVEKNSAVAASVLVKLSNSPHFNT